MARKTITVSDPRWQMVEDYRVKKGMPTWEGAMWELVSKGYESSK